MGKHQKTNRIDEGVRRKCAWLLVATGVVVTLIVAAGSIYSATRNPLSAFEREKSGVSGYYLADKSGSVRRKHVAGAPGALLTAEKPAEQNLRLDAKPGGEQQAPPELPDPEEASPTEDPKVALGGSKVAVALFGIDTNEDREAQNMGRRSDVMVICVVDLAAPSCKLLTVPRDTRATVRRLDKNGKVKSNRTDKINAAYAYGGGRAETACENAVFALNTLLGVEIEYYAAMDMDAIGPLVEAVGGVTVTLPASIKGVGKEGETVTLNAETAYTYIRKRKGVQGGSDLARTARQQVFLKAFAGKVKQMGAGSIPAVWNAMSGRITTNLNLTQVAALGSVLFSIDTEAIETHTLPGNGKTIDGTSYFIPDQKETRKLVAALFAE